MPPELSILRDSSPHPGAGTASRHSGLPFHFPPPVSDGLPYPRLPSSFDDLTWENEEPEEHPGILSAGLSVQCEDTRMVVSIDKESLQVSGQYDFIYHRSCLEALQAGSWTQLYIAQYCIKLHQINYISFIITQNYLLPEARQFPKNTFFNEVKLRSASRSVHM